MLLVKMPICLHLGPSPMLSAFLVCFIQHHTLWSVIWSCQSPSLSTTDQQDQLEDMHTALTCKSGSKHSNSTAAGTAGHQPICSFIVLIAQRTEHSGLCMQVVVAEGAPMYGGHQQARQLAQAGINTTAIADSAIFAMMARVNKVRTTRIPCLSST